VSAPRTGSNRTCLLTLGSLLPGWNELVVKGERDELPATGDVEFLEDPVEMGLHRVPAQRKGVGDFIVAATLTHVVYDLFFP